MSVDVVIPACDEAATIGAVIDAAKATPGIGQIIVIVNGTDNGTGAVALDHGAFAAWCQMPNKGTALQFGLGYVTSTHVLFIDADLVGLTPAHIEAMATLPPLDGQLVGVLDNPLVGLTKLLPPITGQRRLPTGFARTLPLWGAGYEAELRIDAAVGKAGLSHRTVTLHGVTNPSRAMLNPWRFAKMTAAVVAASLYLGPELLAYERGGY